MRTVVLGVAMLGLAGSAMAGVHTFPSAGSTVVGSVGFVNPNEVGYFWSASRGDSVSQTLPDPLGSVNELKLNMRVPTNVLAAGQALNWRVKVNGTAVGMFTISSGFTGAFAQDYTFPAISSPGSYAVRVEAINEIPGGGGSHTFAANVETTATLLPAPGTAALLGLGGLLVGRRRR